ncbi:MAG: hypothetical protein ACYDA2_10400 [Acidimicrobiales bacterium]
MRSSRPTIRLRAAVHAAGNGLSRAAHWIFTFSGGPLRRTSRVSAVLASSAGLVLMLLAASGVGGAAASGAAGPAAGTMANPVPPAAAGWPANCSEESFLSVTSVTGAPGATVTIGTYSDETPINTNAYTGSSHNGIVPPNNTFAPQWGVVAGGAWTSQPSSAIGFTTAVKSTPITVTIPTNLPAGVDTGWVLVFDSDQNKTGGDCGIASFTITVATQSLAGHVYLCVNGLPTTNEVTGGTLSASGPQTVPATANPLGPMNVAAGTYTVDAFVPASYAFVSCTGPPVTPIVGGPSPGALEHVVVPAGGSGMAIFYVVRTSPLVTVSVVKGNDADGSGIFTQSELAPAPGAPVPFRLLVTNTSSVSLTITALTDQWPGQASFSPNCAPSLIGVTLASGASVTCNFTLPGYSPPAAQSLTDTVSVTGCQTGSAANCATGTSTSTVTTIATAPSGAVTLAVTKSNAAGGAGAYSQSETAPSAGASVPFRVVVTNTSRVPVVVGSLSDVWPNVTPFSPACATALVGKTLDPGSSASCDFTLGSYAPAAGSSITDTVTVTGCESGNAANCGSAQATSVVLTLAPATAALAFTGPPAQLRTLLVLGFSLLSVGSLFLWLTRPRRARLAVAEGDTGEQ